MSFINIEIKARIHNVASVREYLMENNADFKGTDNQTDTYFNSPKGRLKLREGNIENNLIYYERQNHAGPKQSNFTLVHVPDATSLKAILAAAMGILVIVEKKREIYFIDNVKFHLDTLTGLGTFIEVEASNKYASLGTDELNKQCNFYIKKFGILEAHMINVSYSDLLLQQAS